MGVKVNNTNKTFDEYMGGFIPQLILDLKEEFPNAKINDNDTLGKIFEDIYTQTGESFIFILDEWDYIFNNNLFELENREKFLEFLKDDKNVYPMPLIIDGVINYQTLVDIKKDKLWLMKMLKNEHTSLEQVFYAFYKNNKCFIIKKN